MDKTSDLLNGGFRDSLLRVMDRKHHSYWEHINGPSVTREELLLHFQQEWEVYVRDFPIFLRRVHDRCPHAEIRAALAENIAEEESGATSGAGPHPELFLYMMEGLGFSRKEFEKVPLLPAATAYRRWIDEATRAGWLVGTAVVTVLVVGSVNDRSEVTGGTLELNEEPDFSDHPLVIYHGLDPRYLELKRVHRRVEGGHRHDAYSAVLGHARTEEDRCAVHSAVERSLELWLSYRDEIARHTSHRPAA